MEKVFFKPIDSQTTISEIQEFSKQMLTRLVKAERIVLERTVPLKVHFGEKKNKTFLKSDNYLGIIDFLKEQGIDTSYMETSVLYGGERFKKDLHLKTARDHGFTQLPIIIADGDQGEEFTEVQINKKHYTSCKIAKAFLDYSQLIVVSHFKGHAFAGFGGAIKQLSMGHAAKGGKMAMHLGIKPKIKNRKCKQCNLCKTRCNEHAIIIDEKSFIDHEKCVGCGACVAICPHKAVTIFQVKGVYRAFFQRNSFREKLVEYAYAAQLNKRNIYINYAMNITKGCDCEPKKMEPIMNDFGLFVSMDPVAIDKACYDMAKERGNTFKGGDQFHYAEKIGLGTTGYELIRV